MLSVGITKAPCHKTQIRLRYAIGGGDEQIQEKCFLGSHDHGQLRSYARKSGVDSAVVEEFDVGSSRSGRLIT